MEVHCTRAGRGRQLKVKKLKVKRKDNAETRGEFAEKFAVAGREKEKRDSPPRQAVPRDTSDDSRSHTAL
jgi:hypothetical protein